MKPWEYVRLSFRDFWLMQKAWGIVDDMAWEKVRLAAYFSANSMFFKKPVKNMQDIIKLASIDNIDTGAFDRAVQKVLANRERFKAQ